jgi:riboflavin kinase/FMN adenylyltransferase
MEGYVATIGMFDGVHLGHQFVLRHVVERAHTMGLQSLCITFDHSPHREQILTPLDEKLRLIRQTGIDRIETLAFTPELKALTAKQFMTQVLRNQLGVSVLLTGYDNRFGHNREEGFDDYVRYGQELGIDVESLPPLAQHPSPNTHHPSPITQHPSPNICSSYIRQLLQAGNVSEATACLGRHFTITGRVVHGEHIGTSLGYPTANLLPDDPRQLIPAAGVYAVLVSPNTHHPTPFKGMMNIGTRPTFGQHPQTLEVHLLHYQGDLYDQRLSVSFVSRIREERRFDNAETLKEQIKQDAIQAEQAIKKISR